MERSEGIEPSISAWKAGVLPLNYDRFVPVKGLEPIRREAPVPKTGVSTIFHHTGLVLT